MVSTSNNTGTVEQQIARTIRELRKNHRLTLQQVASKADVSKSFLSKVERCNVSISIAALSRLANALRVSIGDFFDSGQTESEVIFVPSGQGKTVARSGSKLPYQYEVLIPRRGMRAMQPTLISIDGRKTRFELREHPGEQFIYVLRGDMSYVCGGETFEMRVGDCLYFNAGTPHGPRLKRSQSVLYLAIITTLQTRTRR
jgi:transcriptional regulator with XRE-family HTH domain